MTNSTTLQGPRWLTAPKGFRLKVKHPHPFDCEFDRGRNAIEVEYLICFGKVLAYATVPWLPDGAQKSMSFERETHQQAHDALVQGFMDQGIYTKHWTTPAVVFEVNL